MRIKDVRGAERLEVELSVPEINAIERVMVILRKLALMPCAQRKVAETAMLVLGNLLPTDQQPEAKG